MSNLIQFRLSAAAAKRLDGLNSSEESLNLVAKRLLEDILLSNQESPEVPPSELEIRIQMLEQHYRELSDRLYLLEMAPLQEAIELEKHHQQLSDGIDQALEFANTPVDNSVDTTVDKDIEEAEKAITAKNLDSLFIERICPQCDKQAIGAEEYPEDGEVCLSCGECGWELTTPIETAKDAGYEYLEGLIPDIQPEELPIISYLRNIAVDTPVDNVVDKEIDQTVDSTVDSSIQLEEYPLKLSNLMLAKRLGCNENTLRGKKKDSMALLWTWKKDPDGMQWRWQQSENHWLGMTPMDWINKERGK